MRSSKSLLVLLCILKCIGVVFAKCVANEDRETKITTYQVQCWNVTLETALNQTVAPIAAYMIYKSDIKRIPANAFRRLGFTLRSVYMRECKIADIDQLGFSMLSGLKSLALPHNNLTSVDHGWFADLIHLEQLDLSYNRINAIGPQDLIRLRSLRRLDIGGNRITCFDPVALRPMNGLDKFRFSENPLTFLCRAKLTMWLRDYGVIYETVDSEKEAWLDNLVLRCAMTDPRIANAEELMKECVILHMFNQLRMALTTTGSYPLTVSQECVQHRVNLTECVSHIDETPGSAKRTNGEFVRGLLSQLHHARRIVTQRANL